MVKNNAKNSKWMRRYRTFFLIGVAILSFQIFLAIKFFSISKSNTEPEYNKWPSVNFEEFDQESEINSANSFKGGADYEVSSVIQKNKQKDKVNYTHLLKYDELDFVPPCQITGKEAVSAINRAKTQQCKQFISNITCLSLKNELYPQELKSSCPSGGLQAGKELGCFKDEKAFRMLSGYFGVNKKENSPRYCMKLCLQSGFTYAGVQYSNECFCGHEEPPLASKIPDSSCNLKCPGEAHAMCGGYYTMNVYHTGIKKFVPQTAITESTNMTRPVKIVFLLTLNGRALRQVKRLLKILYHRDHYYYIHIDVRQDYLYRELLPLEKLLPNVRLTRTRFATIWGGASLLEMLRSCMRELLDLTDWRWDFVLNLSESDFPVKPVSTLAEFLSLNVNRNFVKSHGREVQRFIQKQGLDKTFVECEHRMWRIGDRVLSAGIQLDGGSDWVALSRSLVEYVAPLYPDDLVKGLLSIFKHTLLPAESFFHTVLRNSKFCDTYIDNNLHVTNWKRKLGCKCQYKHIVDWCGCSPNNFRPEDWSRVQNTASRQLYFARKFEPIVNQAVILQLELWLHNLEQPSRNVINLNAYWESVYHHRDLQASQDDGLLTISNSIRRYLSKNCDATIGQLLEVTTHHRDDNYVFTLFKYSLADDSLEVGIRPKTHLTSGKNSTLMSNVEVLIVSSNYDQKEQISRNFLRVLSPFSEPVLVYAFTRAPASKTYNLTTLWIGPDGNLYEVVEFSVDQSNLSGFVKTSLKQPILPGVWTTKILYKNSQLAEIRFPIIPLEYLSGSPAKNHQITYLNGGPKDKQPLKNIHEKFLSSVKVRTKLQALTLENCQKIGDALTRWIDELFTLFYDVKRTCVAREGVHRCVGKWEKCEGTNWSSMAPDPKSAIQTINETTGSFDIW